MDDPGTINIPYNQKAVMVLDDLPVPKYVKRTVSLGPSFNHPDTGHKELKRTLTDELLFVCKPPDPNALIRDVHGNGREFISERILF